MTPRRRAAPHWSPSVAEPSSLGGGQFVGCLNLELAYSFVAATVFAVEARPERFATLLPELRRALTVAALTSIITGDLVADLSRFGAVQDLEPMTRGAVVVVRRLLRASLARERAR